MSQHTKAPSITYHHTLAIPTENMFHRHMHSDYEIFYFVRGDVDCIVEGSVYRLQKRDLLLIPPRTFHYAQPLSDSPYERFVINFPAEAIPKGAQGFLERRECIYSIPSDHVVRRFFEGWESMEGVLSGEEMDYHIAQSVGSLLLFLKHLPEKPAADATHFHPILEAILHYIDEHPGEKISAADLSMQFFVSTSWIIHTFRKELGISLMQYVEKKRILYAQSRIRAGVPPTEVAKQCGYDSYVTFYRQYKKILGKTPRTDSE